MVAIKSIAANVFAAARECSRIRNGLHGRTTREHAREDAADADASQET